MITCYRTVAFDDLNVFFRQAGSADAPALLLLHGFPTSSHMFRELIPALADRYRVVAPVGKILHRKIALRCAASLRSKQFTPNIHSGAYSRNAFHRMPGLLIPRFSLALAMTSSSSICSAITGALYPKFQEYFRTRRPPRYLPSAERTTRFSCLQAPKHSLGIFQIQKFISWKPDISRLRARDQRSRQSSATFLRAN